jgi:hypothetical protein
MTMPSLAVSARSVRPPSNGAIRMAAPGKRSALVEHHRLHAEQREDAVEEVADVAGPGYHHTAGRIDALHEHLHRAAADRPVGATQASLEVELEEAGGALAQELPGRTDYLAFLGAAADRPPDGTVL